MSPKLENHLLNKEALHWKHDKVGLKSTSNARKIRMRETLDLFKFEHVKLIDKYF